MPRARSSVQAAAVVFSGFAVGLLLASVLAGGDARQPATPGLAGPPPLGIDRRAATIGERLGPSGSPVLAAGAKASFGRLAASLPGSLQLALAPVGLGQGVVLGGDRSSAGLGSMRALLLVSLLRERGGRGLLRSESARARAAITGSRHTATTALFAALARDQGGAAGASRYMEEVLRASGDRATVVSTASSGRGGFGLTAWTPTGSLKLLRALGRRCLLSRSGTSYVLHLMREVVPSQRWGLGATGSALPVGFTSGWGPQADGSYLVRQSGVIGSGSSAVAIAIVAHPPGTGAPAFSTGRSMLTAAARWLNGRLRAPVRSDAACGNH